MAKAKRKQKSDELPTTVEELLPNPRNPREMTDDARAGLEHSMTEFGDVSGLTFNVRTRRMVAGHQRREGLPADATISNVRKAEDKTGTVGYGEVLADGVTWPVRFVDWPEDKERAAMIAANNPHIMGTFTEEAIALVEEALAVDPALTTSLRFDELRVDLQETFLGDVGGGKKPGEFPKYDDDVPTDYCCPKCGYTWSGDPAPAPDKGAKAKAGAAKGEEEE